MPREIEVKTILNKSKKRDSWFLDDYTVNLYSSCSFNCLYCYIRGSKYGYNLEESLAVKRNAIELLDRQLSNRAKKEQYGYIVLSSATDPYLQIEAKYEMTRKALEVIAKYRFPVHIITKSDLLIRDFDLLHQINQNAIVPEDLKSIGHGTLVTFSFSTLDDQVGKVFEPGATPPSQRLVALKKTLEAGFHAGVSMMPMLPYITDTTKSLVNLFSTFRDAGAKYVMPATITLFGSGKADSKTLVFNAIRKHYPDLLPKYQRLFAKGYELPFYYNNAFNKKMAEMADEFDIPNRIFKA